MALFKHIVLIIASKIPQKIYNAEKCCEKAYTPTTTNDLHSYAENFFWHENLPWKEKIFDI